MKFIKNLFLKSAHFMARTDVFFVLLLWLMLLLVAGTIAQKDIGLYAAQTKYFSSFFIGVGQMVPLPSGYSVMTLIFIGLLSKTCFEKWKLENLGTLISHIAILMLFFGSFITATFSSEGNMVIEEGSRSNYVSNYHEIELAIIEIKEDGSQKVTAYDQNWLKEGAVITHANYPFSLTIQKFYRNAKVEKYTQQQSGLSDHVSSQSYRLSPLPLFKENEMNQAAITLHINSKHIMKNYTLFESMPLTPVVQVDNKIYRLELRYKRTYLPFSLKLNDFKVERYASSDQAQSYSSDIVLTDGDLAWHSLIAMNEPLRYKGYTFFQSSFIEGSVDTTVLAVVNNIGRLFPYISSIILCIGLLIHLFVRLPRLIRQYVPSLLLLFLFISPTAQASELPNLANIIILEQGRVKPLDTFARHQLTAFNGKDSLGDISAIAWLEETLFNHKKAYQRPLFNISNPQVVSILSLPKREKHRYSFKEVILATKSNLKAIKPIEKIEKRFRTLEQQQLLTLYYNTIRYYEISRSFTFILPLFEITNQEDAQALNLPFNQPLSYMEISPSKKEILERLATESTYSTQLALIYQFIEQIERDKQSRILRIIPAQWGQKNNWYSPWEIWSAGQGSPKTADYLEKWKNLAFSYASQNSQENALLIEKLVRQSFQLAADKTSTFKINLEVLYNKIKPFKVSLSFYITAFILLLTSALIFKSRLRTFAFTALTIGALVHITGIIARMLIMLRPPVTTLYESILFVSFIAVLFALLFERRKKDGIGIFIGAVLGSVLQFISLRYASEGDTLGMLEAVLNTNFWLATHVVTITIGYGCCLVAGLLGHIYLFTRLKNPLVSKSLDILTKNILGAALIALFFSVLGTILGGIWADQSWGRFWGWDPKENGAMLICMWLIWLLHGRISGTLRPLYFAAGIAFTNVVVAVAWFGVNLLGVGLHSYGFTNNILLNLAVFCAVELILITTLVFLNIKKSSSIKALA